MGLPAENTSERIRTAKEAPAALDQATPQSIFNTSNAISIRSRVAAHEGVSSYTGGIADIKYKCIGIGYTKSARPIKSIGPVFGIST
ncbi:MAG: hypothetical protein BGP01_03460 [Paludibacter sp. 47-17]|nr:MAG: hypothetical protein ABS72_02050 [Paludibacter sp. SCN 50-10]OJX87644.1 MAG: hypothetical protein BGP01_03460 [Paludibacter sp. 47-17]